MDIGITVVISYVVTVLTLLILSGYFFREYGVKKLRASLAWGVGFLAYGFLNATDLIVAGAGEVTVGKAGIGFGLLVATIAMVAFYYGTSLLFFNAGSFFREKMSAVIMVIYVLYFTYLGVTLPTEGFREAVVTPIQIGLLLPIFLVIGILFIRVARRLATDDIRRRTVLLVSFGWFLFVLHAFGRGLFQGYLPLLDTAIEASQALGSVVILYGMVLGKAVRS